MNWRSWIAVMAIAPAGCMTVPAYDPQQLGSVSEINVAVQIDVWSHGDEMDLAELFVNPLTSSIVPEWSAAARDQVIATIAKTFASEGLAVTLSDARPLVPWHAANTFLHAVQPYSIPGCGSPEDVAPGVARLEVVAIQTVKTPSARAADISTFALVGGFVMMAAPHALPHIFGGFFGAGVTAVRFCLFQAGSSKPAWAYEEWFHGGFDLRDPAKVKQLVDRAREHYRAALSKSSLSAPMSRIQ